MERTIIKSLEHKINQKVLLKCWIFAKREQGAITFLVLRDISGTLQAVVTKDNLDVFNIVQKLNTESVVEVVGNVKEQKQAPSGYEIQVESINILSENQEILPIPVYVKGENDTERDSRMDWRWLDLRKPNTALIFKIWTTMEHAFRTYLITNDFIEIHSPKLTVMATESGAELFEVKYFDKKAYLAQSPQLYKQMAMASGFEKVFEVGPVFRANPSFTSRHDTEFTMYDIEMSFIESHEDLHKEEEKLMVHIFTEIKNKWGDEIKKVFGQEMTIPTIPFPRLTVKEAKKILKERGIPDERKGDMSPEEERAISEYIKETYNHDFVFLHQYPANTRAFYSMKLESDNTVTKTFDLIYCGLEITSGAQREHRPDILESQIKEKGLSLDPFQPYINFFRYGCPPHGGFAPGPTRILMKMLGIDNVREVTYLYRGVNRLTP